MIKYVRPNNANTKIKIKIASSIINYLLNQKSLKFRNGLNQNILIYLNFNYIKKCYRKRWQNNKIIIIFIVYIFYYTHTQGFV